MENQEGNQVYLKGQNGCLEKLQPKRVSMQKLIKVSGQAEKHKKISLLKMTAEKVLTCC